MNRRVVRALIATVLALGALAPIEAQASTPGSVAAAAATVPPVSNLRAYAQYDHTLRAQWQLPAAAYAPGAKVIARYTRGRTPAPTPDTGYATTWVRYASIAQARPLLASTTYTFAVWVRDPSGHLSARRSLTLDTRPDTTPPQPVSAAGAAPGLAQGSLTPTVALRWKPGGDVDIASYRVLRTSSDWAHATVLAPTWPGSTYLDTSGSLRRDTTYRYYLAARDTQGRLGAYTRLEVTTNARRFGGLASWAQVWMVGITDSSGSEVPVEQDDDRFTWTAVLVPGRYTLCETVFQDPGNHFTINPGCWTPRGTVDITTNGPPAAAVGALVVGAVDRPTGIDISLSYQ